MKAVVIRQAGSPVAANVAYIKDAAEPAKPAPGHALVRTEASALNHLDLWVGRGLPGVDTKWPHVSGSDGCGIVEAVGPGVSPAWVGQRVIVNAAMLRHDAPLPGTPAGSPMVELAVPRYEVMGEHSPGTHAEFFDAPVEHLAPVGMDTDPVNAAAFGLAHLTAWSMMVGKAGVRAGQAVLVTGIGGGVALAALAIAKHLGCPVAVTSRHEWKLERAKTLGADLLVHDTGQDWSKQVREWTGKRGVELAVDSSGKATHLKCIKSLARGGAYVTPGCTSGPDATTDLARIFWNQLRIIGSTMGTNAEFAQVTNLFRLGKLKPVVHQVFAAADGQRAFELLEAGEQFGKVVLRWR